jgi:hypothetical protein
MSAGKKRTATPRHSQTAASPAKSTPIRVPHPDIHDTPITSTEQLLRLITHDYPGLTRNPQFPQLLTDAQKHLTLITLLHNEHSLRRGDLTRLARAVGTSRQRVTAYVQAARKPRLYYLIEHSLAKTDAHTKLATINRENNGLHSTHDVKRRLATYCPATELARSHRHQQRLTQCDQYFEALKRLKDGGCYLDIARELGTRHSQIQRWLDGQRPDLVELARRIPDEDPGPGCRWLPTRMNANFQPNTFIRVPTRIESWSEIQPVLAQVRLLENEDMDTWRQRFGSLTQEAAFGHLLGIMVSDAAKPKGGYTSASVDLRLSKKYLWSERLGEATCYHLGHLGIRAQKGKDRDSSAGIGTCHSWTSENSPLVNWIQRSCLGLKAHERTTYHSIKANWMLEAPADIRRRFLQGLNDGDGWASVKDQCLGNACQPNIPFIKQLLKTFQILTTDDGMRVRIRQQESIILAARLPFFLHAIERQQNAEKLAEMMRVRRDENPEFIPEEVICETQKLHRQGKPLGEIAQELFDKYNVSYDPRRISYVLRRHPMTNE